MVYVGFDDKAVEDGGIEFVGGDDGLAGFVAGKDGWVGNPISLFAAGFVTGEAAGESDAVEEGKRLIVIGNR